MGRSKRGNCRLPCISTRYRLQSVDVIVYPGFKAIEAVGAVHIFDYANARLKAAGLPAAYQLNIVGVSKPGLVQSDTLIALNTEKVLSLDRLPDIALIVGARDIEVALKAEPVLVDWCRIAWPRLNRLVGLCSGAFFLAEAGVLDGRKASTHWSVSQKMARAYPDIEVTDDSIFVRQGRIWTSAGVTAALDLVLALVEEDLGRDIALAVARDSVIYLKRSGGQSQFSEYLNSQMTQHSGLRDLQEWILKNLHADLGLVRLACQASMSTRNLSRLFSRETGHTPTEFVEIARVELARRLMEEKDIPLKKILNSCGFRTDDQMRRAFKRRCGVTPTMYREHFGLLAVDLE